MSGAVTSTIECFSQPEPGFVWTIRGWRGQATANAARRGKLRQRLGLLKADRRGWANLLAVATAGVSDAKAAEWPPILGPYRLTVEEWGGRARDLGAVAEACKRGADSLVRVGWLPGDGPVYLREYVARDGNAAALARDESASLGVRLTAEALPDSPKSLEPRPNRAGAGRSRAPAGVAGRGGEAGILRE